MKARFLGVRRKNRAFGGYVVICARRYCMDRISGLINILHCIEHVELASWGYQVWNAGDLFQRAVIIYDDLTHFSGYIRIAPNADPDLGASLVVFKVDGAPIAGGFPTAVDLVWFLLGDNTDRAREYRIGIQHHIDPDPLRIGVCFDE
jgi:hypothetical protein